MKKFLAQESGRSMVEILGVLAIVGVLSVGGIAGYSQAMAKFKITKAMDQIQTMVTNIRTLYSSQRTFKSLNAELAYKMGVLTDETYDSEKKEGVNPFGGRIDFDVVDANSTFTIKYTKLDPETCVKLATANWGDDLSSGLYSISISVSESISGSGVIMPEKFVWGDDTNPLPVSLTRATDECASSKLGSSAIMWEYR